MATAVALPPHPTPSDEAVTLPRLTPRQLFNLSAGIIGLQFAWSMQIALSSRVLEPLGADPFIFGLIWCAGPITGLVIQPLVGAISDQTWTRLGRRRPFILAGAILGALAILYFPFSPTLMVAALLTWVIDACLNTAQGPYRALVPDNAPPDQHAVANAYISFAFGAGSVISLGIGPLLHAFHIGLDVGQQYILAALALLLTTTYASLSIREIRPASLNSAKNPTVLQSETGLQASIRRFAQGNREVHKLCGIQFLTWVGLMCMYIYLTPYVVHHVYQLPDFSAPAYKKLEIEVKPVASLLPKLLNQNASNLKIQPSDESALNRQLATALGPATPLPAVLNEASPQAWPKDKRLSYKQALVNAPSISAEKALKPLAEIKDQGLSARLAHYFYLRRQEEAATQTAQLAFVAYNLVTLLLTIPLGYLSGRIGKKALYATTLVIYSAAMAFAPVIALPWQAIAMMAVAGIGGATILSLPFAMLCEYLPEGDEGAVLGIFNVFVCAPQLISALVIGKWIDLSPMVTSLGQTHQWSLAFLTASVFVLLSAGALMFFKERYPRQWQAGSSIAGGH